VDVSYFAQTSDGHWRKCHLNAFGFHFGLPRGSADMQWNTMPTQLRGEFDNAGSMGELAENAALRGQVARFLHKHK
jgi:hypothetical protein